MRFGITFLITALTWFTQPTTHYETAGQQPTDAVRQATAITYPYNVSGTVELKPTWRMPGADGKVHVDRDPGATKLKVKLDDVKPAALFGGDYNTYVFWAISPEGIAQNLGELTLDGDNAKLETSTTLGTFAMMVTVEPHFLVSIPSRFVVLENLSVLRQRRTIDPLSMKSRLSPIQNLIGRSVCGRSTVQHEVSFGSPFLERFYSSHKAPRLRLMRTVFPGYAISERMQSQQPA